MYVEGVVATAMVCGLVMNALVGPGSERVRGLNSSLSMIISMAFLLAKNSQVPEHVFSQYYRSGLLLDF